MTLNLEAIKARCEKATAGPWRHIAADNLIEDAEGFIAWQARSLACSVEQRDTNADFIAHARTDLPALVAEVERLRKVEAAAKRYRHTSRHLLAWPSDVSRNAVNEAKGELFAALDAAQGGG